MRIRNPINKLILLQASSTNKAIAVLSVLYLVLATIVAFLVIKDNVGLSSCRLTNQEIVEPVVINLDRSRTEHHQRLTDKIVSAYNISQDVASKIVTAVGMHTTPKEFPTMETVLAVIAVESSFKQHAESDKGAKGLLQVTKSSGQIVSTETFQNISSGVDLLKEYHRVLKSEDAALESYNLGLTNYRKGMRAPNYLQKVRDKLKEFV